jgi:lantibiotic modifying enzyme
MLLDTAMTHQGIIVWPPSKILDSTNDDSYIGAAHGSAGIGMALRTWGKCTDDNHIGQFAEDTLRSVYTHGRTSDGATMFVRSASEPQPAPVGGWCHGIVGYLWCLLQACGDSSSMTEEIDWAVKTLSTAMSMPIGDPTYCHGISGQLEVWHCLSAIPRYRDTSTLHAAHLVRTLRLLHQRIEGKSVWCSDDPRIITPDLWIGFLAPATALALHAIGYRGALLSGRWLKTCACGEL